jgi:hypothetical protein
MKVDLGDQLKRVGCYVRTHASVQALLFVVLFFSIINMAYSFAVVVILQSWLPTWHLDRRFPFSMIPLWAFFLVSLATSVVSLCYYPKNRPKLAYDRVNGFFVCMAIGLIAWLVFAFGLIRIFDIGDFYVVRIIQNLFSGKSLVELPVRDFNLFPTLGDTAFIAYSISFLFSYLASWRAFRTAHQKMQRLIIIGSNSIRIGNIRHCEDQRQRHRTEKL